MKRIVVLASFLSIIISCKKDEIQKQQPVPATPEELAAEQLKLTGTWGYVYGQIDFHNVSGIPSNEAYPFKGSASFDGKTTLKFIDYDGNQTQTSYSLSGVDSSFFVDVKDSDGTNRSCKIILLSNDSLRIQNTLTGTDTSNKIVYTQTFVKAKEADITGNIFRITVSSFDASYFDVNINIFITHEGGAEQVVETKKNIKETYSYAYQPVKGDKIRIALSDNLFPGSRSYISCLPAYRGVLYGKYDWQSSGMPSSLDKSWVISN